MVLSVYNYYEINVSNDLIKFIEDRFRVYLLEKEFKQIFRNRFLVKILFVLPVIQLIILPFAADFEMRNINVAFVDEEAL